MGSKHGSEVVEENRTNRRMRYLTLNVPEVDVDFLDELVRAGLYPNRAEAIRLAIRDLRHLHTGK